MLIKSGGRCGAGSVVPAGHASLAICFSMVVLGWFWTACLWNSSAVASHSAVGKWSTGSVVLCWQSHLVQSELEHDLENHSLSDLASCRQRKLTDKLLLEQFLDTAPCPEAYS